jgi:cytochrome c biogenesis protein CcmG/thiol:disulfide interchange protein DsbE
VTAVSLAPVSRPSRRRLIGFAIAFLVVVAAVPVSLVARRAARGPLVTPIETGVAPDFTLTALDGATVRLSEFRGHPVIVNFWASWCVPCRQEFPVLRRALRDHRADGLVVLGVIWNDLPRDARAFARDQQARWPMLIDPDRIAGTAYGITAVPQSFVVRPDGTLSAHVYGSDGITTRILDRQVERARR